MLCNSSSHEGQIFLYRGKIHQGRICSLDSIIYSGLTHPHRPGKHLQKYMWLHTLQTIFQEHLEVGMVQKAFWCVRGGDVDFGSELPAWYWPAHEVYFTIILLLIPGGIMMAAYGAIARKLCQCMKERRTLTAERGSQKANE